MGSRPGFYTHGVCRETCIPSCFFVKEALHWFWLMESRFFTFRDFLFEGGEDLRERSVYLVLFVVLLFLFFIALSVGRYPVSLDTLFAVAYGKVFGVDMGVSDTVETVLFQVRLPRIFAAILIGVSLSVAGTAYQGIFKNPLVSPDILGATSGAAFGAALAILLSKSTFMIHVSSFLWGLIAVFITYGLSLRVKKSDPTLVLVLTGILVGTLFSSFVSLIKYVADPYDQLPTITFWLMGSLSSITFSDLYLVVIPVLLGAIPLFLVRWRLNVLSFGDEEAMALGIDTKKLRLVVILSSTLMTASVVSISGIIGWVGLVIPHLTRLIVGPNYQVLLPASILTGAIYLLLVDTLARVLLPMEIPLGILTALIGAPFFIYLLTRSRRGWV